MKNIAVVAENKMWVTFLIFPPKFYKKVILILFKIPKLLLLL